MASQEVDIAIVLLGATDCGKTTFITSLLAGLKAERLEESSYRIRRSGRVLTLHLLENDLVAFQQSPFAACALLCYDTFDIESLTALQQYWHHQLTLFKPADVDLMPLMLLGLKCDGADTTSGFTRRAVDPQIALRHGREMRITHFGQCSAKSGQFMKLVAEDFLAMLKQCVSRQTRDSYSYCVVS